jgi:uncharacterized lipoprotein
MPKLPVKKNWGRAAENENPLLTRQLDEAYTDIVNVVNTTIKKNVTDNTSPSVTAQVNSLFEIGDIWVRKDTNQAWIMTSRTNDQTVNWQIIT